MSVDFYVAVPAARWPTAAQMQRCMTDHAFPVRITRFPGFDSKQVITEGVLVTLDGNETANLQGEVFSPEQSAEDVYLINKRLESGADPFRISRTDAVMSVHVALPKEVRATSYVISGLIVCFGGYGFEPQGNTHGRAAFAKSLVDGAAALKGL